MIFSIVEKVNDQERVQKLLVKGSSAEVSLELKNIITEMLKRHLSEELLISAIVEAIEDHYKKQ